MSTKNNNIALLFLLFLATIQIGCESRTPVGESDSDNSTMGADSTAMTDNGANTNSQTGTDATNTNESGALAKLNAVNQNEVDAAMAAQKKKISQPVMDYAKMLEKDHAENMTKTTQLAASLNMNIGTNDEAQQIRSKGADLMAMLQPKDGKDFETAYLDGMISGHTEALSMLDSAIGMVTNDAVKQHLTETRSHVSMHLEQAKKLRGGGQVAK